MIRVYANKGFQLTFENGYTLSVMIGRGNYCDNRSMPEENLLADGSETRSSNAELAVWDENGDYVPMDRHGENVIGWIHTDEVAQWINKVSNWR